MHSSFPPPDKRKRQQGKERNEISLVFQTRRQSKRRTRRRVMFRLQIKLDGCCEGEESEKGEQKGEQGELTHGDRWVVLVDGGGGC